MDAAVAAGFQVVEFTLNTPGALELITEFSRNPKLIVGAGTVLSASHVQRAVEAGADFLVSPVADEDVIVAARRQQVTIMPGCATPTEMWLAFRAGAPIVKLFPAPAGGPTFLRSILAPLPFIRIVPTNGITAENAAAYIEAGAFAVGCSTCLFPPRRPGYPTIRPDRAARTTDPGSLEFCSAPLGARRAGWHGGINGRLPLVFLGETYSHRPKSDLRVWKF